MSQGRGDIPQTPDAEGSWTALSGARSRVTLGVAAGLWVLLTAFIVMQSVTNFDPFAFIRNEGPKVFRRLDADKLAIEYSQPAAVDCATAGDCLTRLRRETHQGLDLLRPDVPPLDDAYADAAELRHMHLRIRVRPEGFVTPYTGVMATIHLPRMRFQYADAAIDGLRERRFFSGERLMLSLDAARLAKEEVQIELVLSLTRDDARAFLNWAEPAFLTDIVGREDYMAFMRQREADPVRQINAIVRVSMGVFALLLFIIIESSSEALGLAFFMGFNSLSTLLGFELLRRTWLPDSFDAAFWEYLCGGLGEVFRLYYFLHLARVINHPARRWLLGGLAFALPYAGILYLSLPSGWGWQRFLVGSVEATAAGVGLTVCLRQLYLLRGQKKIWRTGSLAFAALAAACQLVDIAWNYPVELGLVLDAPVVIGKVIHAVYTNSAYLLALSMFIGISTLENRVRALSAAATKAQEIERELELGRSVQRAFMTMPKLPESLSVESFHEAALYVSGDTFYTHWSEDRSRFVCLLNDVTGHGVQAALKAFGCTVIARSLWRNLREGQLLGDRRSEERLSRYGEAIATLINNEGEESDFNAMVGVELNTTTGEAKFYRANYNNPVIVERRTGEGAESGWGVRQLLVPNRVVVTHRLQPMSLIMLVSDGILADPRGLRSLLRHVETGLAAAGETVDAALVKRLVLGWAKARGARQVDDQTLLVFQWHPRALKSLAA